MLEFLTAWHGHLPDEEEVQPVPKCYTLKEWQLHWIAAKNEIGSKARWSDIMSLACDGCQVAYQEQQLILGYCEPISFADTPFWRAAEGNEDDNS